MWRIASVFLDHLLALAGASHAQTCKPPGSLDQVSAIRGTVTLAGNAPLAAGNDATGGAFASYSLPQPNPHWRLSFRVECSQLGEQRSLLDSLTVLSATTRKPYPDANGVADLLRVQASTTDGASVPSLRAVSACGSQPSLVCSRKLAEGPNTLFLCRGWASTTNASMPLRSTSPPVRLCSNSPTRTA